ncbi:11800_t:CDS:1, partial [Ambispora gerdemannii]
MVAAAPIPTSDEGDILSGNQVVVPISLPITVSGTAVGVLGTADSK